MDQIIPFLGITECQNVGSASSLLRQWHLEHCETILRDAHNPDKFALGSVIVANRSMVDSYLAGLNGQVLSHQDRERLWPNKSCRWNLKTPTPYWVDILHLAAYYGKPNIMDYALSHITHGDM